MSRYIESSARFAQSARSHVALVPASSPCLRVSVVDLGGVWRLGRSLLVLAEVLESFERSEPPAIASIEVVIETDDNGIVPFRSHILICIIKVEPKEIHDLDDAPHFICV